MRQWLIQLLQRLIVWLGGPAAAVVLPAPKPEPVAPVKTPAPVAKPETALRAKAREWVRATEVTHAGKDGEFKRHQVLAKLLKDFPPKRPGDRLRLSRAIDDAVEQL